MWKGIGSTRRERFLANGESVNAFASYFKANSVCVGRGDSSRISDSDGRLDDVFGPVARARRNVAGQREAARGRHRNVVRAPDAGLKHPAAPDGHVRFTTDRFDTTRFCVAADATELDVDDTTRAQSDCLARILRRTD